MIKESFILYLVIAMVFLSSVFTFCSKSSTIDNAAVLFSVTMRSVRMHATLLENMGNPIQCVGWNNKGEFKEITESKWTPVIEKDGKESTPMMFKYLLIPGAPWMQIRGDIFIAAKAGARVDKIGKEGFHPLKVPGREPMNIWMWNTIDTNGKWIGKLDGRIYECNEDGSGTQIGLIAYRDLTLESGETVKVFMTKGMAPGSVWESDVGDTFYRELIDGKGTPIAKLEYKPLKLDDGTETVILMSRTLTGNAAWTGVRNGKIIKSE